VPLSSHNDIDECELSVEFDAEPMRGSAHEEALVGLVGPLRMQAAVSAEGRLTQQLWRLLAAFREDFEALQIPTTPKSV